MPAPLLRRLGIVLAVLLALVVVAAGAVWGLSARRLTRVHAPAPEPALAEPAADAALLARGEHLVRAITKCGGCHGADLGGGVVIPEGPIGLIAAPNLTRGRGGLGGILRAADFERAVRHGIARGGRSLVLMPSDDWARLDDADLAAIIAYIRSVPPVDREMPSPRLAPLGRALLVAGRLPVLAAERIPPATPHGAPPADTSAAYGEYLANVGGCTGCHGPGLSGGHIPGTPPDWRPAANLTPAGLGTWSGEDFARLLRTGVRPNGTTVDPLMPIEATRLMTDAEIAATWAYLRTVPPRAYGTR